MMNRLDMMNRLEQSCDSSLYRSIFALLYLGAVGLVATTDTMNGQGRSFTLEETTWEQLQGRARVEGRTIHLVLHRGDSPLYEFLRREVVRHREFARFFGTYFTNGAIDVAGDEGERISLLLGSELEQSQTCLHIFIAPNGRLLHRIPARAGSLRRSVSLLLNAGLHALESDRQYYTLRDRYRAGDRGDDLLLRYAMAAREAEAPETPRIAEEYVAARIANTNMGIHTDAISTNTISTNPIQQQPGLAPLGLVLKHQLESTISTMAKEILRTQAPNRGDPH